MSLWFKKNNKKVHFSLWAIVLFFVPLVVSAANLSLSPSNGNYEVGDRIQLRVLLSSDVSVNAVSGVLATPSEYFVVESVSKNASVLNFWVTEPTFSKSSGVVRFEGVALNGFSGSSGTIVTVTLKAVKAGSASVQFQTGQILANDGQGTDVTGSLSRGTYTVVEPIVKPKPPAPEKVLPVENVEIVQPLPTLKAPIILKGRQYSESIVEGTSLYPYSQVLLTFVSQDNGKIFITGLTLGDGSFTIPTPRSLRHGYYSVSVVIVQEDSKNSEPSNTLVFVIGNIFSDIGWQIWLLIFILILALIYLVIGMYVHRKSNKRHKKMASNEQKQAREVLHKSFDVLREDIRASDEGKSTINERKRIGVLKKDLDDAERVIDKEIKDIESL